MWAGVLALCIFLAQLRPLVVALAATARLVRSSLLFPARVALAFDVCPMVWC
jgi:hypothetical protein